MKKKRKKKAKIGRPKLGKFGVARVMISVETELLKKAGAYAKKNHLSRSKMISMGLRMVMAG